MASANPSAEFAGGTALVTGAARSVGKETVRLLHGRGARIVALDRRPEVEELAEIAEVLCFLASPRSSFVTGAVVAADGGFTTI